jgi:hypothetical protein
LTFASTSSGDHAIAAVHDRTGVVCEQARARAFSAQSRVMSDPIVSVPDSAEAAAAAAAALLLIPRRTAAGVAALARRTRELTPRQRTTLFMVDGKRSVDIVIALASQAGARSTDFFDLVTLGLVETPRLPAASVLGDSSLLPSAQSLQGDSTWSQPPLEALAEIEDAPLDEARALLIRAVRSEAPVAGTFTLLRLKRASTRAELEALLDEVEQRLRKPHRRVIAAQMLRHVRHLLTLPAHSRFVASNSK